MSRTQEVLLDFTNLGHLDEERINRLLKFHISNIARDCINRPGDKTKRKVTLEFYVSPIPDPDTGEATTAGVQIECKSKVPVFRSKRYEMRLSNAGLTFNADFPDDIDQPSLFPKDDLPPQRPADPEGT